VASKSAEKPHEPWEFCELRVDTVPNHWVNEATKGVEKMNKTELTEKLAKQTGMSKADSKRAIDAIFSTAPREGIIASAVSKGDRVQITGFGTFERRKRKKRNGRNPQTGETITIAAAKYPAFVAGKSLKERIQK